VPKKQASMAFILFKLSYRPKANKARKVNIKKRILLEGLQNFLDSMGLFF
jgi:hypothetical protein